MQDSPAALGVELPAPAPVAERPRSGLWSRVFLAHPGVRSHYESTLRQIDRDYIDYYLAMPGVTSSEDAVPEDPVIRHIRIGNAHSAFWDVRDRYYVALVWLLMWPGFAVIGLGVVGVLVARVPAAHVALIVLVATSLLLCRYRDLLADPEDAPWTRPCHLLGLLTAAGLLDLFLLRPAGHPWGWGVAMFLVTSLVSLVVGFGCLLVVEARRSRTVAVAYLAVLAGVGVLGRTVGDSGQWWEPFLSAAAWGAVVVMAICGLVYVAASWSTWPRSSSGTCHARCRPTTARRRG